MTFDELQKEISQYVYTEDDGMSRIALAAIIANRMKLSDPVWLLLIGPSSSGKSQVLRPLALTDKKYIHRVDDLTENTLLSGMKTKGKDISLLKRIGAMGIIVISDFTVLFSKSSETRATILSQLRMVYDGEMTKYSGNNNEAITWNGYLGVLAGSTPSIYTHFEEVADMGERFIYYRMKPYNIEKATRRSLSRNLFGKELDEKISILYETYLKEVTLHEQSVPDISPEVYERIIRIAMFAAVLRTPTHYDKFQKAVDRVPISEMPMRIAIQLSAIARGLSMLHHYDTGEWNITESDISYIEWCAYSLANEERRACLRVMASLDHKSYIRSQTIADSIGLNTNVVSMNIQHLAAIGILERHGDSGGLKWRIKEESVWLMIRKMENITKDSQEIAERDISTEEAEQHSEKIDALFDA